MKLIEEITTKVVTIDYDEDRESYAVILDKGLSTPAIYGDQIVYEKRTHMFIDFGSADISTINNGDTITIQLFEHLPGDKIKLFSENEYTFISAGYHRYVSSIKHNTDEISWDEIEAADIARHTGDPRPTPSPKKHYVGYFAIDNWHMVGGHFPTVKPTSIYDNLDDCLNILMQHVDSYQIEDSHHNRITREDIINAVNADKYGYARIHFEYPREGEVTIISNC